MSEGNRNLAEAFQLGESDNRPPLWDFHETKLTVATFAALNWSLFGDECHFYTQVLALN